MKNTYKEKIEEIVIDAQIYDADDSEKYSAQLLYLFSEYVKSILPEKKDWRKENDMSSSEIDSFNNCLDQILAKLKEDGFE